MMAQNGESHDHDQNGNHENNGASHDDQRHETRDDQKDDDLQRYQCASKIPFIIFFKHLRLVFKLDALGREILGIAIPAILTLAADPVASLIDTIFIGRLGAVEIGGVGVAIAIFNQASRITMYPIVSITTSFVAEEHTLEKMSVDAQKVEVDSTSQLNNLDLEASTTHVKTTTPKSTIENTDLDYSTAASKSPSMVKAAVTPRKVKRIKIPSATTAIIMGTLLGVAQALLLIFGAKVLLRFMGVKTDSPMYIPASQYLTIRALGSPAVLISLAMQGVFRGFKDTITPLYATVLGDAMNVVMDPIFIFVMRLGVRGAAISHALSQYLIALILFLRLMQQVNFLAPSVKELQFARFVKTSFLMLARVIAVTSCVTFAAGLAARQGPTPMAAFQICLQVWLTSSLLADGLAVSGQAIIAYAFTENDHKKAITTAIRVAQMGVVVGLGLLVIVGAGLYFGAGVFSKDKNVLHLIYMGIPFIAGTQPINTLAFVLDGVNFGSSDFAYTAFSMIIMAIASITSEYLLAKARGYIGIWYALVIYMGLRTVAGVWRVGRATGPWRFLRGRMFS